MVVAAIRPDTVEQPRSRRWASTRIAGVHVVPSSTDLNVKNCLVVPAHIAERPV